MNSKANSDGLQTEGQTSHAEETSIFRLLMTLIRMCRDLVARFGLEVRTVRGREQWRAGAEVLWRPFDSTTERVRICAVSSGGRQARFLVRDANDHIQYFHSTGRYFAEEELVEIGRVFQGGAFVDVGANVGNHAVFAAINLRAKKVVAFEPNPIAERILRCNIALNDLNDQVVVYPVALSSCSGRGTMAPSRLSANLGATPIDEDGDDIDLRTGDSVLAEDDVGFIKIDVEGHELKVLDGLKATIARCRPTMMIEVDERNRAGFDGRMRDWGYTLFLERPESQENSNCFVRPENLYQN